MPGFISLRDWDTSGKLKPYKESGTRQVLDSLLSGVGQAVKKNQDQAYRRSASKMLGVPEEDINAIPTDQLSDLIKEKRKEDWATQRAIAVEQAKPKEYKPETKEDYIETEIIKNDPAAYYEQKGKEKRDVEKKLKEATKQASRQNVINKMKSWKGDKNVTVIDRLKAILTPGATDVEQRLGPLNFGGLFQPPATEAAPAPQIPMPTAPAQTQATSPFADYPDAVQGPDGIWRVTRNGQVYKVEE